MPQPSPARSGLGGADALLDLSNGEFTAGGLKALAALKELKELNLSGSNAKAADVADLKKALPDCKIEGAK